MENLISTSNYIKYEKKKIEWYDPLKEIEDKMFGDYIDEDEEKEIKMYGDYDEDEEYFNKVDYATVNFSNKRINQKYYQLSNRYEKIINKDEIFGFCLDIIQGYIEKLESDFVYTAEKKIIKNGKLGYHDSITTINVMLDTRINRYINEWRGTYEIEENGVTTFFAPPFSESLETELKNNQSEEQETDSPKTIGDMTTDQTNIFSDELSQYTKEEIDNRLEQIYIKAKLTDREIEVLKTLERTPNNRFGETYTREVAGEMLKCSRQNIGQIFNRAKKKIINTYCKGTRQQKLIELEDLTDNVEDEKDIINHVLDNLVKEYINYILYDSDLDNELVRYFNKNNQDESTYYSDSMKEFSTYFLKEIYKYKEITEYNIKMQDIPEIPPVKVDKWKYTNIDTNIYTYIVESRLKDYEKKGDFIIVDNEKYYYVKRSKQKEEKQKEKHKTLTHLKR